MRTLGEVLLLSTEFLKERGVGSPRLDAELLIGHALGLPRLQVYLQFERLLPEPELERIRELVRLRGLREPLAWLTGEKEFHGLPFAVRPGTLVPRPDTETLVDAVLERIPDGEGEPILVADVGTGTGCVGLTLAAKRLRVRLFAVDLSRDALECARDNAVRLGIKDRVALLSGDLLAPVPRDRPLAWVVSNPPYIQSAVIPGLEPEVSRHEPRLALDGGPDGLRIIRRLVAEAATRVQVGLALEIGHDQGERVLALCREAGFQRAELRKDLAGNDRVVLASRA